ncbi:MAG TPA: acyltransferase, partial [Actinoplanes sp.]|nr:acyltransferase [Actinoplanes sp.]
MTTVAIDAPARSREDSRITGADGVRAIAALMVVLHHLFQRLDMRQQEPWLQETQRFLMKGSLGVSVFFVLSGLLLSYPFWMAYLGKRAYPSIGHYIRRRAARIIPGFYAALLVSYWVGLHLFPDAPWVQRRLLAGLTFSSGFHWMTFFPTEANGPLWSIGFEVVSYVLMPLAMLGLFWMGRKRGRAFGWGYWAGVIAVTLAVNAWILSTLVPAEFGKGWQYGITGGAKFWMPDYNPVGFFAQFAIGILAAGFIAQWRTFHDGRRSWAFDGVAAVGFLAAAWLLWVNRFDEDPDLTGTLQNQPYNYPYFPALVTVLLGALAFSKVLGRIFDNPFARYTAKISFGIYIWHYLALHLVSAITPFEFFGIGDPIQHLMLSFAVLCISYCLAAVSWHLIEAPFLDGRWARWTRRALRRNANRDRRAGTRQHERPATH